MTMRDAPVFYQRVRCDLVNRNPLNEVWAGPLFIDGSDSVSYALL